MENKDLERKIETALASLDHIQRAEANPFLFTQVMEKMTSPAPGILKPMVVWQLAASIILVVGLNLGLGFYSFQKNSSPQQPTENAYFNNHLYYY